MLPVIAFVGIILVALMCVAAGNKFKMFPYLDMTAISFAIATTVVSTTGAFAMSLYWRSVDKKRRKKLKGFSTKLMKISTVIRAFITLSFILLVSSIIFGAVELTKMFEQEALKLPEDTEILVAACLTGFAIGAAVALFFLSIFKAIGISRSVGREKPTHQTGSSDVVMKRYGKISMIVLSVLVVILCVSTLIAQLKITEAVDDISYISFIFGDEAYITKVDVEYFEKNPEGYIPDTVGGKKVTEIEKGWIDENDSVKKLYANADISIAEGALEPLRGLQSLTFAATKPIKDYFGGNIPDSLKTVTVLGTSGEPLTLTDEFFDGCENISSINFKNVIFESIDSDAFDDREDWLSRGEERNGILYLSICEKEFALKAVPDAEEITLDISAPDQIAKGILNSLDGSKEVSLRLNESIANGASQSEINEVISVLGDAAALANITSLTVEEMYAGYNFAGFTDLKNVCIENFIAGSGVFSFGSVFGSVAANIETVQLKGGTYENGCFDGLSNVKNVQVENVRFSGNLFTDSSSHRFIILVQGNNTSFAGTTGDAVVIYGIDINSLKYIDGSYYTLANDGMSNTAKLIYMDNVQGNVTVSDTVIYDGTEYTVTEIASTGLRGASMTGLVLPESLTAIEKGVIADCDELVSLEVPFLGSSCNEGKILGYLFGANNSTNQNEHVPQTLRSVTVNGGKIAAEAFKYCTNLNEVTIGENVVSISGDLFIDSGVSTLNYNAISATTANYRTGNYFGNDDTPLDVNFGEAVTTLPAADGSNLFGLFQSCTLGEITVADLALYATLTELGEKLFGDREIDGKVYAYKTPNENGCIHEFGNYWCFTVDGETKTYSLNEADYVSDEEVYCPDCGELIMVVAHTHEYEYTGTLVYENGFIKSECICSTCNDIGYENIFQVSSNTKWIIADDAELTSDIYHQSSATATVRLVALKNVTFSFNYVVSSESRYDRFSASAPNYSPEDISGEKTGSSADISLSEGEELVLMYSKDGSVNNGQDKVVVTLVLGDVNG